MLERVPCEVVGLVLCKCALRECLAVGAACKHLRECAAEPVKLLRAVCAVRRFWRWCCRYGVARRGLIERLVLSLETLYTVGNEREDFNWNALLGRIKALRGRLRGVGGDEALGRFDARMAARYEW